MPRGLIPSFTHRAWWWVFGLFIATPALILAVLGLQAIRAREIEREQGLRDQQAQLAKLVGSALATAFDRVAADALGATREDELVSFEIDDHGVFRKPRIVICSFHGSEPYEPVGRQNSANRRAS